MLPSFRQLEYFVAVAEHLSFGRAADACHVSQPGLSTQLRQLEDTLGVRLFERDRRRVLLTPAGRSLLARARRVLIDGEALVDAARVFTRPLTGELRLGIIPTVAPYLLPAALPSLHRHYPDLRLLLREDETRVLVSLLAEGRLDLLLLALQADLGDAETMALFDDPFVLAVPAGHRLARRKRVNESDLVGEQVLLLQDGHCLRDQALRVCDHAGATELGDFRATSLTTLAQMVAGGIGVTLLPSMSLAAEVECRPDLVALPFSRPSPRRTIGLAWRPTTARADEFRLLAEALQKH